LPAGLGSVLFVIGTWWCTTGVILFLDRLAPHTFRWSLAVATAVLVGALFALDWSSTMASAGGAYAGFAAAVLVWAWLEMTFLMGALTGPRRRACPSGCHGWRHFVHAVQAILYHELATLAALLLVGALCWQSANPYGFWTFLLLWGMRLSAKLNLFFGVPNVAEAMLPAHLKYLASFFRQRPMNPLFPLSVTVATVLCVLLIGEAWRLRSSAFHGTGMTILATLSVLALIEHWLLAIPLPADTLWRWTRRTATAASAEQRDASSGMARAKPLYGAAGAGQAL
jgi:putative photosynthetic complex assembly protein 2